MGPSSALSRAGGLAIKPEVSGILIVKGHIFQKGNALEQLRKVEPRLPRGGC